MMQAVLAKAEQAQDILHKAVDRMQDMGAEFSDARSQTVRVTGVSSMNGDIRQLVQKSTGGVCLRAWVGGRWGYGTATTFDGDAVVRAAEQAVRNASGERKSDLVLEPATVREHRRADVRIHPDSVDLSEAGRPPVAATPFLTPNLVTCHLPSFNTTAHSTACSRPSSTPTPDAPFPKSYRAWTSRCPCSTTRCTR